MSWRFRQSFTVIPGLRLNLSKSGLSASIGGSPFTINVGPNGALGTASIPGTGLSVRHRFDFTTENVPPSETPKPDFVVPGSSSSPHHITTTLPTEEIHSASTELLTSETLKDVKRLIQTAFKQRDEISHELEGARTEKVEMVSQYEKWANGFLFKRLFTKSFAKRKADAETSTDKVAELEEQLRLTTITTYIEVDREQSELYYRMKDEFAALCECAAIWDVKSHRQVDQFHERTTANVKVDRQGVKFALTNCDLIHWEESVPHLKNSKGGDFFLYPGFILYRAAREAFSIIEYHDVRDDPGYVSFQETEKVPSDSKVVGQTWLYANKNGSRDLRFNTNHEIPIAQYGIVTFRSNNGLWEEFHFSDPQKMWKFLEALKAFKLSFAAIS